MESRGQRYAGPGVCCLSVPSRSRRHDTYEANTTSLPQGDMDADPTGSSRRNDPSFPKLELSNAEAKPSFSTMIGTAPKSRSFDGPLDITVNEVMRSHNAHASPGGTLYSTKLSLHIYKSNVVSLNTRFLQ